MTPFLVKKWQFLANYRKIQATLRPSFFRSRRESSMVEELTWCYYGPSPRARARQTPFLTHFDHILDPFYDPYLGHYWHHPKSNAGFGTIMSKMVLPQDPDPPKVVQKHGFWVYPGIPDFWFLGSQKPGFWPISGPLFWPLLNTFYPKPPQNLRHLRRTLYIPLP